MTYQWLLPEINRKQRASAIFKFNYYLIHANNEKIDTMDHYNQ